MPLAKTFAAVLTAIVLAATVAYSAIDRAVDARYNQVSERINGIQDLSYAKLDRIERVLSDMDSDIDEIKVNVAKLIYQTNADSTPKQERKVQSNR